MPSMVGANKRTVVHAKSNGMVLFMPDVCLTPAPPSPPIPIPYPNIAMASDADKGAKNVTVDGNPILVEGSTFSKSSGDEAGTNGGVMCGSNMKEAEFIAASFDVFAENKGVARAFDLMLGNKKNTPPMPVIQPPLVALGASPGDLEKDSIEVVVQDASGKALADVKYVLETPDGQKIEGKTDASGKIKVQETVQGLGRIVFPDLALGTNVSPTE
jgi:hypothetical protein